MPLSQALHFFRHLALWGAFFKLKLFFWLTQPISPI